MSSIQTQSVLVKKREPIFDLMKGIGIILMMLGHEQCPMLLDKFIYSFHMPMFFILAGYFAKTPIIDGNKTSKSLIIKDIRRLLFPYFVTSMMLIVWGTLQSLLKEDASHVMKQTLSFIWANTAVIKSKFGDIYIGPMWFLWGLFWAKLLLRIFAKYKIWILPISIVVSIISVIFSQFNEYIPFCILPGLGAFPFVAIGWLIRQYSIPKKYLSFLCLLLWMVEICSVGHFEVSSLGYQCYPINLLGACGGTFALYWISKKWCSIIDNNRLINFITKPLLWCGMNSMVILCIHNFEDFSSIVWSIRCRVPFEVNGIWMFLFCTGFTLILSWILLKIPFFKKVYQG